MHRSTIYHYLILNIILIERAPPVYAEPKKSPLQAKKKKLLIRALEREYTTEVPFWLMRQAGRYLPEYQAPYARKPGRF